MGLMSVRLRRRGTSLTPPYSIGRNPVDGGIELGFEEGGRTAAVGEGTGRGRFTGCTAAAAAHSNTLTTVAGRSSALPQGTIDGDMGGEKERDF